MNKSDLLSTIGILVNLLIFGVMGMLGQGVRAVVGLKSAATLAAGTPTQQTAFDAAYFFLSLMIGLIAGILAGLGLMASAGGVKNFNLDLSTLLGIAAAGYAGADFIENAFTRLIPGTAPPVAAPLPPAPQPPPPVAAVAPPPRVPPPAVPSPSPTVPPAGPPVADTVLPPNSPPATVPVRLAVSGADPNTVTLSVDQGTIGVDANGYAELILETGIAHSVTARGTKAGTAVSGQITISVSPDDVNKAYELTLS